MRLKHDLGAEEHDLSGKVGHRPVLQGPWRALPELLVQEQSQVQGRVVNQNPFQDVFPSSKVNPSHAAGFQAVSERSFPASCRESATIPCRVLHGFDGDWHRQPVVRRACSSNGDGLDPVPRCRCVSPTREDRPSSRCCDIPYRRRLQKANLLESALRFSGCLPASPCSRPCGSGSPRSSSCLQWRHPEPSHPPRRRSSYPRRVPACEPNACGRLSSW